MSHPLLGDPSSMSALAATLRRTAVRLRGDGEEVSRALEDAAPGWSGPTAVRTRRRTQAVAEAAMEVADALDGSGAALQRAATDLAADLARLRSLEEDAVRAGLQVRDGTIERSWGITGLADARREEADDRQLAELQHDIHQVVTAMGRHRSRLATECDRARALLEHTVGALRA